MGGIFLISIADSILSGNFLSCVTFLPPIEKHLNLLLLLNESFIRRVGIILKSITNFVRWVSQDFWDDFNYDFFSNCVS